MHARSILLTFITVLLSIVLLGVTALTFSPAARTEIGLAITAAVWALIIGSTLSVVARRLGGDAPQRREAGERVAERR